MLGQRSKTEQRHKERVTLLIQDIMFLKIAAPLLQQLACGVMQCRLRLSDKQFKSSLQFRNNAAHVLANVTNMLRPKIPKNEQVPPYCLSTESKIMSQNCHKTVPLLFNMPVLFPGQVQGKRHHIYISLELTKSWCLFCLILVYHQSLRQLDCIPAHHWSHASLPSQWN